jgi:hypothetical protein
VLLQGDLQLRGIADSAAAAMRLFQRIPFPRTHRRKLVGKLVASDQPLLKPIGAWATTLRRDPRRASHL